MKAKLIKTPENLYKLKFNNDNDMLLCATALLSSKNCDEIFGIVNIEKLAEEYSDKEYGGGQSPSYFSGFSDGFNKAMELNEDKVFNLEDMLKVVKLTLEDAKESVVWSGEYYQHLAKRLLQSLQQPTEMNVEIEMEDVKYFRMAQRPKLDSNGCLILKKI
jgi:hypothetical protein